MSDTFYIGVYLANRAFGGNEEGGWWYDCGELQYTIKKMYSIYIEIYAENCVRMFFLFPKMIRATNLLV